jgi:hypothetical protein
MDRAFVLLFALVAGGLDAAEPPKEGVRYGIAPDLKAYSQATAKQTLASVLKTIDAGRFDYLAAQLADPDWVDERVGRIFGGRFDDQVEDIRDRLDPGTVKLLRRFLAGGEWTTDKDRASVRLKDVGDRGVFFRKKGERWFLEHRSKPAT